ncbi:MAG: nucleotidyltransferase family protein [Actinomycetota bacterium]
MPKTAAIVLAAGGSRRLGSPKQLLAFRGRPLLEHVVAMVSGWPVDDVVVVVGAHSEEILSATDFGKATVLVNEDWEEGIASSIRVGFDFLSRDPSFRWTFVAMGDQPDIPSDVPPGLLVAAEAATRTALVPVYRYERANPVLFDRALWGRLMSLEGDVGASGFLKAHPEWVEEVRFDHLPPRDIDTEADAAELGGHGGHPDSGAPSSR